MSDADGSDGKGQVRDTFSVTGRGTFLTMEEGWTGRLRVGSILEIGGRQSRIKAIEFARGGPPEAGKEWLCLALDDEELAATITKGSVVTFLTEPPAR
jgi:hypothetical protein